MSAIQAYLVPFNRYYELLEGDITQQRHMRFYQRKVVPFESEQQTMCYRQVPETIMCPYHSRSLTFLVKVASHSWPKLATSNHIDSVIILSVPIQYELLIILHGYEAYLSHLLSIVRNHLLTCLLRGRQAELSESFLAPEASYCIRMSILELGWFLPTGAKVCL